MKSKPLRICVQHLSVFSCTVTLHLSVVGCDSIRRSRKKDSKNNYYFKREKFCQELNLAGGGASKLNQRKNSTKSAKLITRTKFQRKDTIHMTLECESECTHHIQPLQTSSIILLHCNWIHLLKPKEFAINKTLGN